ncbi:MAG: flagellar motor stator protein MotA [Kangiellaceae bacterium]|nr:flagellar motor stator protein MotA [Kangiellaceae bacterium]
MNIIVGVIIVFAAVLGGFVLSHGELIALWQPFELLIICGAAAGAFVIANPLSVQIRTFKQLPKLLLSKRYTRVIYLELLALLYQLFSTIRREGLISVEKHIEEPQSSAIFSRFPAISKDQHVLDFICDYLRLMVIGDMTSYELENLMDIELETHHHEQVAPSHALAKVADALPGFGIVAAVLGIVITMGALGGPPEELGLHVAAALVGTFLGILLAYGFISPTANAMENMANEEAKFYECMKVCILATVNGMPPQIAVEFGRKTLFSDVRPNFYELEQCVKGSR